ncbi:hypothetical protein NCPPB3923_29805 [Burkholderia glumae]|nr:hypothetical protein NCPPB3923_29805 [Burkholderia glumae]
MRRSVEGRHTLGLSVGEWVALGVVRFVLLVGIVRRCLHYADIGFAIVRVGGVGVGRVRGVRSVRVGSIVILGAAFAPEFARPRLGGCKVFG